MKKVEIDDFDTVMFESNNDFELGRSEIKRSTQYRIYNKGNNKGLVVYIPGFGGDLGNYTDVFCRKIAEKYNIATMCVDYFCLSCRPEVGAQIKFEMADHFAVRKMIIDNGGTPCDEINRNLDILKNISRLKKKQISLTASLVPKNNEYQNFGIIAALDILNAVRDAVNRFSLDVHNIILVGSSYGGYIGNLVTKISPGYIRAVFDNSSWANPNFLYIAGRELHSHSAEYNLELSKYILLRLYVISPWTLVSGLPNSMEKSRLSIRSFESGQLRMMAEQGASDATFYYFYHSIKDTLAPTTEKIDMANNMIDLGFNVKIKVAEESDVDGVFIKKLSHGMELSMTMFFDLCFDFMVQNHCNFISNGKENVSYSFEDCCYRFDLVQYPVKAGIDYF